ncbi:MAG: hypothetical protein HC849_15825 [Oscillatoriales cyanobacterium RU_3_3]|nr:hypothetical protein [Oscillatoriales cyanobacterium RU_3_3]
MSSYFSRLIQQTGMALGTSKVSSGADFQERSHLKLAVNLYRLKLKKLRKLGTKKLRMMSFNSDIPLLSRTGKMPVPQRVKFWVGWAENPPLLNHNF